MRGRRLAAVAAAAALALGGVAPGARAEPAPEPVETAAPEPVADAAPEPARTAAPDPAETPAPAAGAGPVLDPADPEVDSSTLVGLPVDGVGAAQVAALVGALPGARLERAPDADGAALATIRCAPADCAGVARDLNASGLFRAVDYESSAQTAYSSAPDDQYFPTAASWGLKDFPGARFAEAWPSLATAAGPATAPIAVIDSGFSLGHPDRGAGLVAAWDFGENRADVSPSPSAGSSRYHGVGTSGVIGAATDNAIGVAGAAWDPSVLAYKVSNAAGDNLSSAIAGAIRDATQRGAKVINLSLAGAGLPAYERAAIDDAIAAGVVVIASSGNTATDADDRNGVRYPAAYPPVVSVGAIDPSGARADFSTHNANVDL
ncbi:MAG: S8 family serine peptidase, partial [Bifidobacteriaceae bacterium]|nr:S8 family serine peptidase [Bifidobacteriaceae bacterium]